jgi:putative sterol carrier protein
MASGARDFFERLEARLDPARLAGTTGSFRFDIDGAGSWRVDVVDGRPSVSETADGGDCVIRMKEEVFVNVLGGEQNPMTAFMTGKIKIDGDIALALKLKDLLA